MSSWHRIASIHDIPPGTGKELVAGDRVIAVFNVDGTFYALDGVCPHAGGPLGQGTLSNNIVTCPWHGWQFDVSSGKHCLNPNLCQPNFPTRIDGNDLYVELP